MTTETELMKYSTTELALRHCLVHLGENPDREGLLETPKRIVKSWDKLFGGYKENVKDHLRVFEDGACDEMVVLRDIEFFSTCLAGSTFVETPSGRIPISRLTDGAFVYCWDEDRCQMTIARCQNPRITGKDKRLWRVYTDKDTVLCTGEHRFLTHTRGWVEAQHLTTGDSLVALNKGSIGENKETRTYVVWTGMNNAIPEHRFIYSSVNGQISSKQHIHHIDGCPNNNAPENLTMLSNSEHTRLHRKQDPVTGFALYTDAQREAMKEKRVAGIRKSQTEDTRARRAASVKRYWDAMTPEQRAARNHRVLQVEQTNWYEDVWCMDVPGYHNFVANGVVVHNCEHHMLPFFGKAHIAYVPNGRVLGVSKLARILEVFARRMQIQERIGQQVTEALMAHLKPLGAACVLEAQHFCMTARGVQKQNSIMCTASLRGCFKTEDSCRSEFYRLIGK